MTTRTAVPRDPKDRHSERGLTLIEALVAITVFAVVFIAALTLYSVASNAYLRTDSAVIQQQNIRFTMDRMSETLNAAGAGHNMLGARNLADEQVEGFWESAVFVRGDFDGLREGTLENAAFPIVTTGNDEIVGFVLLKNGAGTVPIQLKMDLTGSGRDAIFTSNTAITGEETVTVNVAATTVATQIDPPYQLARVTFVGNAPRYEIIADNINQLQFSYLPETGTTPVAGIGSGADTERDERALIRKISVKLIGQTDRPDLSLKTATGNRTFTLEQTILPPNLGIIGGRHDLVPPLSLPAPAYITACTGHCRKHLIRWPSAAVGVTSYKLLITAAATTGSTGSVGAYLWEPDVTGGVLEFLFTEPVADITAGVNRQFTFKVAPTSGGATGTYTAAVNLTAQNDVQSQPRIVENVDATPASGENALMVTWDPVLLNIGAVTATSYCVSAGSGSAGNTMPSPLNGQAVDLTNAKVYRVRSTGGNNGSAATTDISDTTLGTLDNVPSPGPFIDRLAAPCESYFYRVKACDTCYPASAHGISSDYSAAMATPQSFTPAVGVVPGVPLNVGPLGAVASDGTNYIFDLKWYPVTTTADGDPAAVSHYQVERSFRVGAAGTFSTPVELPPVDDVTQVAQTVPIKDATNASLHWRYQVRAIYDCAPAREGALSLEWVLTCTPGAGVTLDIVEPTAGDVIMRPGEAIVPLKLSAAGTGFAGADIVIKLGNTVVHSRTMSGAPVGGFYDFPDWAIDNTSVVDGVYTVEAAATVNSCRITAPPVSFEIDTIACGQRIVDARYLGSGAGFAQSMTFRIENTCQNAVTIEGFTPFWSGAGPANPGITAVSAGSSLFTAASPGALSGASLPFSSPVSIATASVFTPTFSVFFTFSFSDNFTSDNGKDGVPAKFTSISGFVTSPTPATNEELVDGGSIP